MQCTIVDVAKCIYLVRGAASGPGKPVHVQYKSDNNECIFNTCVDAKRLASLHTADKNYTCIHMKSIINFKEANAQLDAPDLFSPDFMHGDPDISENDKDHIRTLITSKLQTDSPIIRNFDPHLKENNRMSGPSNQYFSVLYGCALTGNKKLIETSTLTGY